jgi:hypothetical protein
MQLAEIHCSSIFWFYIIAANALFGEDVHLRTFNSMLCEHLFDSIYDKECYVFFTNRTRTFNDGHRIWIFYLQMRNGIYFIFKQDSKLHIFTRKSDGIHHV